MTRIFNSGRYPRRIDTAAKTSRVGVSPQHAMTTFRIAALVVAGPLPDTDSFGAWIACGIHVQPLRQRMLAGHHDVDVVAAAQAMIEDRQQAIGVGRQIDPHDIRLLVHDVVEEARILMREAVVILLPDMRGEQIIQRRDIPPPGQFPKLP